MGNTISIPMVVDETVVATTTTTKTTMVLTQKYLEHIDNKCKLKGYPKSNDFFIGYNYWMGKQDDLAIASFIRGAKKDGCVPCMYLYVNIQSQRGNLYLVIPWAIEGAIRGHTYTMMILITSYRKSQPFMAMALADSWTKMKIELDDTHHTDRYTDRYTEERRKEIKKNNSNFCCVCAKKESKDNDVTLVKCGICKYYAYCGKKCQTYHWKEGKHMNECRQVILLRKYCKPQYVKEIREAIIGGQDPKEIHTLQRLRMKLGLNRPKEEYEELLLRLANDDTNDTTRSPNRYEYLVGRKDGTVHIGSTPNVI